MTLLIGLDIGTTSTIGILIDGEGGIRATASRRSELISKHPNWAEEDPALWWANVCAIVPELLAASGAPASEIAGIGVTGMVPTVILLDAERRPLRYSIQQNDARAVDEIEEMRRAIDPDVFFRRTGGSINQQLVAPTLRWLERHEPGVLAEAKTVVGSYDYITARLTGELSVEQNWALESGFMDLAGGCLDEGLVKMNEGVKYTLLDNPGKYTVRVASFRGEVVIDQVGKARAFGQCFAEGAEILACAARLLG